MTIKAALLDERGIFLRVEEVDAPTDRHLPQITECDLPAGKYIWIADDRNPFGGAFWPVDYLQAVEATREKALRERAAKKMKQLPEHITVPSLRK